MLNVLFSFWRHMSANDPGHTSERATLKRVRTGCQKWLLIPTCELFDKEETPRQQNCTAMRHTLDQPSSCSECSEDDDDDDSDIPMEVQWWRKERFLRDSYIKNLVCIYILTKCSFHYYNF